MKVTFNWPEYLIPFVAESSTYGYIFDLFLNTILLENDETVQRRMTRIVIDLIGNNEAIWRWELPQPALWDHLKVDCKILDVELEERVMIVGDYLAGQINDISPGPGLSVNQQAILRRFPIRFSARSIPDTLVVRVYSGSHLIGRNSIGLKPILPHPVDVFPVEGTWQVFNNFDNILAHRQFASREFSIDLVQVSEAGLIRHRKSDEVDDFICFDKPVFAMKSGTIASITDGIPDNLPGQNISSTTMLKLKSEHGYYASQCGNSVLIKHSDETWSYYSHLRMGSIRRKPGDQISAGDQIGAVGNSGRSEIAHLHVQMNAEANPYGSRSIPIYLKNVQGILNDPINIITQNLSIIHSRL